MVGLVAHLLPAPSGIFVYTEFSTVESGGWLGYDDLEAVEAIEEMEHAVADVGWYVRRCGLVLIRLTPVLGRGYD
ncbi:hypothetical protein N7471_008915 [Penicillium samsonianum]|uniref:uncharacterized protein n=1 Tax=Penicillium samsonianum TaxID=1882272 RepID=UPI0025484C6B|nr:uncharacterized protein N7471_008915 [Penicillium samsonianum]KAJ6127698.1 hypothetical protein N7471_008915 [Penicillium samsonianum]